MHVAGACEQCESKDQEILRLRAQIAELRFLARELDKLCTLQKADLDRAAKETEKLQPNRPERVSVDELQLAFAEVVASFANSTPANDAAPAGDPATDSAPATAGASAPTTTPPPKRKKSKGHGRRALELSNLEVRELVLDPDEVLAAELKGYRFVGNEISDRIAYRRASYIVLRLIRRKYIIDEPEGVDAESAPTDDVTGGQSMLIAAVRTEKVAPRILCAEIPGYFWPRCMADVSAITQVILAKYDMCLPLHRQERVSPRCGFHLPRSTQCDWLSAAYGYTYRIVDAMMEEARSTAFCIGTDATGAPVRMPGECANWHVFVFVADADHIVFRSTRVHTSAAIASLLDGFTGHLLSDASIIYDALHRDQGIVEVCCWAHLRRYFWKCRATEPALSLEGLAIISKLFEVGRDTNEVAMPARTEERARQARPILDLFDRWIERIRPKADDKSPLAAALTYYDNQRDGLRAFLADGRLRLDNNICEQQLRNLVLGRHNWNYFENEAGLNWYCVFRSLIASCALHGLEPQDYLDEILRLAPHWPANRMLALSPKHWAATREGLSAEQRAIVEPAWRRPPAPGAERRAA